MASPDEVREKHLTLKQDPALWARCEFVGIQDPGTHYALELRNCTCCARPSTLALPKPFAESYTFAELAVSR